MKLSVIIPTYKRSSDLNRLLRSLNDQTTKPAEILVIIGPGDIDSFIIANQWKQKILNLRLLEAQKSSVIHALNIGLREAQEDIICFLDDDTWLPPTWAINIVRTFEADDSIGAYGGPDFIQLDDPQFTNPTLAYLVGKYKWDGTLIGNHHRGVQKSPIEVDVLKGVNLSFRKCALNDMQIDSALEYEGAEFAWEVDISQRIALNGFKVIYDNENYLLHFASPRLVFDDRIDIFSPAWPKRCFNESFVIAKFRPLTELTFFILKSFLLGSRMQPGIIWSFLLMYQFGWRVLKSPYNNIYFTINGALKGIKCRYSKSV